MLESGLCNVKSVGFDIDKIMLRRAKINLDFFKIKNYKLKLQDATSFVGNFDSIVTDLPYGKNTKITSELNDLYLRFLKNLVKNKIKKSVIGFSSSQHYFINIKTNRFNITQTRF